MTLREEKLDRIGETESVGPEEKAFNSNDDS